MNRILIPLATASIFALGCGHAALDQHLEAPAAPARVEASVKAPAAPLDVPKPDFVRDAEPVGPATAASARAPGDFVVYRFTGSFRKAPLTLTERVIARKGSLLTIDFAVDEGADRQELRVRIDEASPTGNEVVSVLRLDRGVEKPSTVEAYEALIARTALAADSNDALVGTEDVTVDVGGAAIPAKKTTYRVRVGKRRATLSTFESATFAWGDVGGEITTASGKVLYRAEVVEAGHDDAAAHAAAMAE
jgi:hypothetical protein